MKTIIWTCIYTHIIIATHRQPNLSVFSSGDTDLISRDVCKAQRLRLTGTEELKNSEVKLTSLPCTKELTTTRELTRIKELTSTRELTSIKELTSTNTKVLTSTRELTSMKELTITSTKEPTSMISTPHSRWSLSRIFQTGLLHNTRYVFVTLTCYSLFFSFALPCKCSFPLIPCCHLLFPLLQPLLAE